MSHFEKFPSRVPSSLPEGWHWGTVLTRPGNNLRYIIRDCDDFSVLVPEGRPELEVPVDEWLDILDVWSKQ